MFYGTKTPSLAAHSGTAFFRQAALFVMYIELNAGCAYKMSAELSGGRKSFNQFDCVRRKNSFFQRQIIIEPDDMCMHPHMESRLTGRAERE